MGKVLDGSYRFRPCVVLDDAFHDAIVALVLDKGRRFAPGTRPITLRGGTVASIIAIAGNTAVAVRPDGRIVTLVRRPKPLSPEPDR